jgi:hypothetical protein
MTADLFSIFDSILNFNGVRIFWVVYGSFILSATALRFREQLLFLTSRTLSERRPKAFGFIQVPVLSPRAFTWTWGVFCTALLATILGVFVKVAVALALVTYFLYFAQIIRLESIRRKTNLFPFIVLIVGVTGCLENGFQSPSPLWPLLLIKVLVGLVYFSSAYCKFSNAGLSWAKGGHFQSVLISYYLWGDRQAALVLSGQGLLCTAMLSVTLFFEATFVFVIIFVPKLVIPYALVGLFFHAGTYITMRVNYLRYFAPVYFIFLVEPLGPLITKIFS